VRHRTGPSFQWQFFQISKIPTLFKKIRFVLSLHFSIKKSGVFPEKLWKFDDEKTKNIYIYIYILKPYLKKKKKEKEIKKKKKNLVIFFVFWK